MKFLIIFLMVFCIFCGCQKSPGELSIVDDTEIVHEYPFEISIPSNWEIEGEVDSSNPNEKKANYLFFHPKTKKLYIKVDALSYPEEIKDMDIRRRSILGKVVRSNKKIFDAEGYKDFDFSTKEVRIAGYKSSKIIISGSLDGLTREIITIIVPQPKNLLVASYQWFSKWGPEIKGRLDTIVKSLQLIQ